MLKECHQLVINLNEFCATMGSISGCAAMAALNAQRLTANHRQAVMQSSMTVHAQRLLHTGHHGQH